MNVLHKAKCETGSIPPVASAQRRRRKRKPAPSPLYRRGGKVSREKHPDYALGPNEARRIVETGKARTLAAAAEAKARKQRLADAARIGFEGDAQAQARVAHHGVEVVALGALDSMLTGQAYRTASTWWPDTLYKRGRLDKREYAAARMLADFYAEAGFVSVGVQSWRPAVDKSTRTPAGPAGRMDARAKYMEGLEVMTPAMRAVVEKVVVLGGTLADAADDAANRRHVIAAHKLLRKGLARAADHYGL